MGEAAEAVIEHSREEIARRERLRTERRERAERVAAAQLKAGETLRSVLGEERWARWEREHVIEVEGSDGLRYLITPGTVENVREIDEHGVEVAAFCAHPPLDHYDERGRHVGELPAADVYLAQLLALETDAPYFRRVANMNQRTRGRQWLVATAA